MSEFVLARVEIEETAATIAANREFLEVAVESIKKSRDEIERQIRKDGFFLTTLEPYEGKTRCGKVIDRMCKASRAAGVGPMATVAGTIAQEALESMMAKGLTHGWVDNGGDVALVLERPVTFEILSDLESDSSFGFELEPSGRTIGVCSSSGRLGHSLSFGDSDIAVAVAEDAVLADALATAIGNRVQDRGSLQDCFDPFKGISGFIGGLVIIDGCVSVYGDMPKLVEVEHNSDRLTVHSKMSSSKYVGGRSVREVVTP